MLRYAHTISSASRRPASRHPMFCDPCTAGSRQFHPLRNNNMQVSYIPYTPVFSWSDGGANPTVQNMDVAYVVFSKICFVYARYNITDLGKSDRSNSFLSISLPKEIDPIAYNAAIISPYYQISNEYTPLGVRIENKIIYIVNGIGGDYSGPYIKTGYQGFSVFFMCK